MFKVAFGLWHVGAALVAAAARVTTVGGDVVKSRIPYLVNLHHVNNHVACGGVLIAPQFILTSFRCSRHSNLRFASIGATLLGENEAESFKIVRYISHPDANVLKTSFDLVVVELDRPSTYPPVRINWDNDNIFTAPGTDAWVRGFGAMSFDSTVPLKESRVAIWSKDKCQDASKDQVDYNSMLCVGGDEVCVGNWGGPVVVTPSDGHDYLVGVISRFAGCQSASIARIQPARDFLAPFLVVKTTQPPPPTTTPGTTAPPGDDPPLTDEPRPVRTPPMDSVQSVADASGAMGAKHRSFMRLNR